MWVRATGLEGEGFEFTLLGEGDVEVVNCTHDEPEDHTYTVHVEGGIPSDCTCPAFEYQEGACKHMVAIAIREPILEAVSGEPAMRADGGMMVEAGENDGSDERPEDCDCIEVAGQPLGQQIDICHMFNILYDG